MFAASVALIAIVGWLGLRAGRGPRVALLAAWLAAASPLLVVFARFARPYALVALCAGLALLAADAFRRRPSGRNAVALGSVCALGTWFNVSALPALAVLGWLGLMPALTGRLGAAARRAAFTGALVGGVLGFALLGPSVEALRAFAEAKAQSAPASWTSWGARRRRRCARPPSPPSGDSCASSSLSGVKRSHRSRCACSSDKCSPSRYRRRSTPSCSGASPRVCARSRVR